MLVIGNKKLSAFSLIEIIVSLAIFSFIIMAVVTITLAMVNAQKKVQAQLFLAQTAQTTLESMSRQIRYGYNYTGVAPANFSDTLKIEAKDAVSVQNLNGNSATTTLNLVNAENSPYLIFESQNGNPNTFADQNAFCAYGGKLYKISKFNPDSLGKNYEQNCDGPDSVSILPDNIILIQMSYDIYGGDPENPKNPMVRVKLKLKHEDAGELDVQTTVTQRLVSYF